MCPSELLACFDVCAGLCVLPPPQNTTRWPTHSLAGNSFRKEEEEEEKEKGET